MKVKVETTNKKGERGFTLVETSISMVVMMVAGLAMSSLFVFSMQNNVGGNERASRWQWPSSNSSNRSVTFEDTTMTVGTTTTTISNGDKNYSVVRTITDETNADGSSKQLRKISITVTCQAVPTVPGRARP